VSEAGIQIGVARARSAAIAGQASRPVASPAVDEAAVRAALTEVMDPELPMLSVVDLGIIHRVEVEPAPGNGPIRVEILPTFVGCPALELIKSSIAERLAAFGRPVEVTATFEVPWTSERISPAGRVALLAAGIAPPGEGTASGALIDLEPRVPCPHCGSRRTVVENLFGPSQCRTIRYCADCRQPFESIKSV
jgi:ring-1,2-phenylacetyl-CoA epoxidase subunit PaaD